ncbi:unnamed protein product [Moneuplotes crassus]|uniref:RING-type domain-containing protein n=1 Tax=Euplotes crassus TaxID=5936 RepID=A0AAD1XA97_EUPCR|nr:unnamed protein product [Moneuplotes crassus]
MESYSEPVEVQSLVDSLMIVRQMEEPEERAERLMREKQRRINEYGERMKKLKEEQRKLMKEKREKTQRPQQEELKEKVIQGQCDKTGRWERITLGFRNKINDAKKRIYALGAQYQGIQSVNSEEVKEINEEPDRNASSLENHEEEKVIQPEDEELKTLPDEDHTDFTDEADRRAAAAEARKEKMKRVLELREKAKEMYSKRNIDERTGNRGIIGRVRRQMRRPEWNGNGGMVFEELKEKELVFKEKLDIENTPDSELIQDYKDQMILIRDFILFNKRIPDKKVNPKDFIDKKDYLRKQLNLNSFSYYDGNMHTGFKIIETVNLQKLFVYDPEHECYSVISGEKAPTDSTDKGIFSYFNTEGRECIHCTEQFQKGDILMKLSACGHTFHADCAEEYMYYSNKCPLCRARLYKK